MRSPGPLSSNCQCLSIGQYEVGLILRDLVTERGPQVGCSLSLSLGP